MCCLSFLPGRVSISPGSWRDYKTLARFHYRAKDPATQSQIWTVHYHPPDSTLSRVIAVAVVSYPTRFASCRRRALGLCAGRGELEFINRHLRTISRVIVHPQFRALGLSSMLVRWVCKHCDTRYVEALAVMGRAHPFFEKAGMTRFDPDDPSQPVYFLFDRETQTPFRKETP